MQNLTYDLSNAQKSIYFTEKYYSATNINNICGTAIVCEKLNFKILEKAINVIIKNNDSFRINFIKEDNLLKQYVKEYEEIQIELVELNSEDDVESLENMLLQRVFDLEKSNFEFKMFKFSNNTGGFLLNVHHIVADAWSLGLTCRKIVQAYHNLLNNKVIEINEKESYINYIKSELKYNESNRFKKDKEYWENRFNEIPNIVNIPTSKNSVGNSFECEGNRCLFKLEKNRVIEISEFCKSHKISIFNFFMATLAIYMYKISNTNNFVIGTPILNRTNPCEKNTTGMFVNIAPLLIDIKKENTFNEVVSKISSDTLSLLRHQRYSYSEILKYIRTKDTNFPSLFNVLFSYQITKANNEVDIPYTTRWAFNGKCADDLDIQIYDLDETNELNIAYDYKISKFNRKDIENIHNYLSNIIEQVIKNDEINVRDIELFSRNEKEKIIHVFNKTERKYEKLKTVVEIFEEQVNKTPNDIAVVFENKKITYEDLNKKANKIAQYLRKNYNIKPGDFVSILLNRSIELIACILGVVKSGATYVAIDPEYPVDRINYMINDCKAKVVFINEKTAKIKLTNEFIKVDINLNEIKEQPYVNLEILTKSKDLLYVIYTSGSTGKPKGVTIQNYNVNNFVNGMKKFIDYSAVSSMLSVATVCFDMFVFELWGALLNGLKLVLANENEQKMPHLLNELCVKNDVDIFQTTPSRFNLLFDNENIECFTKIKHILVGGEKVPQTLFNKFKKYKNIKVHHMYGPTETTVWSTGKTITDTNKITIGKPIANTKVYILDDNKNICPIGVPGEIYISGDGVGGGYFNNPELNQNSFIKNPFNIDETMYKTGDLGMFDQNGEITYLNRIDNQVKIRGYRIELDEIEKNILLFEGIKNCVVIKREIQKNSNALCAYYTEKSVVDLEKLKKLLKSKLPTYMIPQYFIRLEDFPYTQNGKIDKKVLPIPKLEIKREKVSRIRNEIDAELVNIVTNLLEISDIDINDNLFDLGMDSLIAINLLIKIRNEFNVELNIPEIFNNPIIKDLSDLIMKKNTLDIRKKIIVNEKKEFYPLSNAEKRIYYASYIEGELSTLYNINGGIIFYKKPNITKLNRCLKIILNKHDVFKSYFIIENNNIVQKFVESIEFDLKVEKETKQNIADLFESFVKPFNLENAPLFRAKIAVTDEEKYILMIDTHHIICDGTSLNIFLNELSSLYDKEEIQNYNKIKYTDYILWEKDYIKSPKYIESEKYWIKQFEKDIPILNLPTTYQRKSVKTYNGDVIKRKIDSKISKKINDIAKKYSVTPNIILLAAYYIVLYKYTGQNDIIIGMPTMGRNLPELNNLIGMFVNTLPIRNSIDKEKKILDILEKTKSLLANSLSHQEYSLDALVSKINVPRDTSRNFLFDVLYTYQTKRITTLDFKEIETNIYIPKSKKSKFDISLEILPLETEYLISFEYCTDLFDKQYINDFAKHYINVIKAMTSNINQKIKDISILDKEEQRKILFEYNNTNIKYPSEDTFINLFEKQVRKTPNDIAIVFENNSITYMELNRRANQLARYLRKLGLTENSKVGIMLPRSMEILVGMLGALKAGICYIPIDIALPEKRIQYMLENSNIEVILTFDNIIQKFNFDEISKGNIVDVNIENSEVYRGNDEDLKIDIDPQTSSYAIYTSGSTGNPKGVLLNHKALNNLTNYLNDTVEFLKNDYKNNSILSITTISFDIFIFETLIALQKGLKVIMASEKEQNTPILLNELMKKYDVRIIQTTPSRMEIFINNKKLMTNLEKLKYVILAGEPLTIKLRDKLLELGDITIYNGYGPSETPVFSTFTDVTSHKEITIGKPLSNTQIYILDKELKPVPLGKIGEAYIAGDGLALEYINNEKITNERFIKNPFIEDSLMYKTGDLVRYNVDGEILYCGREDNQVKIRGLRIELDEIEKNILKFPNINQCIISVKFDESGRQYIVAYLIVNEKISINNLRDFLRKALPKYMIPSYFMVLDKIPYLPNGKINKKALPKPEKDDLQSSKIYVAPKTHLEIQIANIFQNLLSISPIGLNDNFFELGGDSILAINLQIELSKITNAITYADIFLNPTISDLIIKIKEFEKEKVKSVKRKDEEKYNLVIERKSNFNEKISYCGVKNIFLTGSTGFLGVHILSEFIENEKGIAYCLVRRESGITAREKIIRKLHFYFDKKYDEFIDTRIKIIEGEITKQNFGMSEKEIKNIFENISCVINSAAKVSHFGNYDLFKRVNVDTVKTLLDICKKYDKKVYHISTISVSGVDSNNQNHLEKASFSEKNLYIEQNLENVYTRSKYEAEKIVLDYIEEGLDAYIIRIGNLTNRFSDLKFQDNYKENAFLNRLTAFVNLAVVPRYLLKEHLEFTPVDICANAVIKIITHTNYNRVFHLYNQNHVTIEKFVNLINNYRRMNFISNDEFLKEIDRIYEMKNSNKEISGIIRDFDNNKKLKYRSDVKVSNTITNQYLKKTGFIWPKITDEYLNKFIKYLLDINKK